MADQLSRFRPALSASLVTHVTERDTSQVKVV